MNRYAKAAALAAACALVLTLLGCSGSNSAKGAAPAETADEAVTRVAKGLSENRPQVLWESLPPSYREDINGLIQEAAAQADPELWNKSFGVIRKVSRLLDEKREFILNHPMVAQQKEQMGDIDENWDSVVGIFSVVVNSELGNLEQLAEMDVHDFLSGTGHELMNEIAKASALTPEDSFRTEMSNLAKTKATVISSDGDTARVKVEVPGKPVKEEDYVRVEGYWVTAEMANDWDKEMAEARQKIAELSGSQDEQQKQKLLMQISMVDGAVDSLLNANSEAEFQAGIGAMMGMAMGAMMSQAAEAQPDSSFGGAPSMEPGAGFGEPSGVAQGNPGQNPQMNLRNEPAGRSDKDAMVELGLERANNFPSDPQAQPRRQMALDLPGGDYEQPVSGPKVIQVGEAKSYVGQVVQVTRDNGSDMRGRLTEVTGNALVLEQELAAGHVSFRVRKDEIASLNIVPRR
ncbi:hypothetical protein ABI59_13835 [Acidobacteria bacterium Mor1]|nr:hypothetical protein ABI59_13835 [Acidobacteria bacterium Mor1]